LPGADVCRSALEAARTVLKADFCAVAWRGRDEVRTVVIATHGISEARASALADDWLHAARGEGGPPRASRTHRIEPVLDPAGVVRGALVAELRSGGVRPGDARALMPVFAYHLGLLLERTEAEARRTAAYEAVVQIGMQIQASEADPHQTLQLIVERARELLGTDVAWIGLMDEEAGTLDMRVADGARTEPFMHMRLKLGDGVGGVVVATGRPVVLPDYRSDALSTPPEVRAAVLGEGIGSMLCCPMFSGDKVIGALYVGSRRPAEFTTIQIALTSALAAQGAIAIENGRLYEEAQRQNELLEHSFAIHRTLTDAALAGAGRAEICVELARLLDRDVVLSQDVSPPFCSRYAPSGPTGPDGTADVLPATGVSVPIVASEELGRLHVCGVDALTALQAKALEQAATVLALELVRERAAQELEWQLQGDLLSELLDSAPPVAPSLRARARRHGLDLDVAHRIIVVQGVGDPGEADLVRLLQRVTGRSLLHRDAALVNQRGDHVAIVARGDADDPAGRGVIRAVTAAAERRDGRLGIGISDACGELAAAYRQALACARLALAREAGIGVVRADRLGPLRFLLDAPDVAQVRAIVVEQLGPLVAHDDHTRTDLFATLRAFIRADGNVAETAKACFIHKNTLRYRLQRVTEVLGRDPGEPDAKYELRMAFDLLDLFDGLGVALLSAAAPAEAPQPLGAPPA
jgi:DNA-binding PucR family transcriptional regulator/putative methionine-R-sulfoxide reductase with GAF domain